MLLDVFVRVDVLGRHPGSALCHVADKLHGNVVSFLEAGLLTDVSKVLALLLGHVIVMGDASLGHASPELPLLSIANRS